MNILELERSLRQLRLGGMAAVLETRLRQARAEPMAPIDLVACLVSNELVRRSGRLLERRRKQAGFRDPDKSLDNFDFSFNPKMNRSLVFDLATAAFVGKREDAFLLGPSATWHSDRAAVILQDYKVMYRETHVLLDQLSDAVREGRRKESMEDIREIIMRRYERCSTLLTSNSPVGDWGKLLGGAAALGAMLDRLLVTDMC